MKKDFEQENKDNILPAGQWLPPIESSDRKQPQGYTAQTPVYATAPNPFYESQPLSVVSFPVLTRDDCLMIQKEVMKTSFKKLILIFVLFSVILFFNMLSGMLGGYFYQTLLSTLIILVLITECAAVLWYLVHRQFERNYSLRQVIDSDCIVKLYHDRIEDYTSNFSYVMPCSNIKYVLETKKGIYVTDNLNISICYPAKYMTPINAMRIKDVLYGIVPVKKWRVKGQIQAQLQQPKSIPVLENTEEEVYWSSAISKSVRLKGAWRQFGIILLYILIVTLTFSAVVGIQEAVEYNDPVNFLIMLLQQVYSF